MEQPAINDAPKPRSDLGIRTASGVVMMGVAALIVWAGGWPFLLFVIAVGVGVLWEWWGLVSRFAKSLIARIIWAAAGIAYVGLAMLTLVDLRNTTASGWLAATVIGAVVATDIGAYIAGRTIGGPRIAPRISPSKTWAGLGGGVVAATLWLLFANVSNAADVAGMARAESGVGLILPSWPTFAVNAMISGACTAIVAQSGDFFESWMKRRAGVKDSGTLIPGHGGLFDRVDGLLALLLFYGLLQATLWS